MTPRVDVYLSSPQYQLQLTQVAKRLGYTKVVHGVEIPNLSALIQAIASGEVEVVRREGGGNETNDGGA